MKKFRKYFFRTLAVLVGLIILLFVGVFIYVSVNKKKIINEVTAELSKKINGQVSIKNVELSFFRNFPTVSVLLHDVKVTDTQYTVHKHAFFEAEEVFAQLSIKKLIKKQSPLKGLKVVHGSMYIFTDTTGYSNDYLFKQKRDSTTAVAKAPEKNALQSVELNDFRVVIDDRKREKLHDLAVTNMEVDLDDKDLHTFLLSVDAKILVHSLAFNLPAAVF